MVMRRSCAVRQWREYFRTPGSAAFLKFISAGLDVSLLGLCLALFPKWLALVAKCVLEHFVGEDDCLVSGFKVLRVFLFMCVLQVLTPPLHGSAGVAVAMNILPGSKLASLWNSKMAKMGQVRS